MFDRTNIVDLQDYARSSRHGYAKRTNQAADRAFWKGKDGTHYPDDPVMTGVDPEMPQRDSGDECA